MEELQAGSARDRREHLLLRQHPEWLPVMHEEEEQESRCSVARRDMSERKKER